MFQKYLMVFYDDDVIARTNMIHAKLALSKFSSVIIRELMPLNKQGSWCLLHGRRPLHIKELVARIIWCGTKGSHSPQSCIKWFQAWDAIICSIMFHRLTITIGKHHTCHLCTWRVQVAWVSKISRKSVSKCKKKCGQINIITLVYIVRFVQTISKHA